MNKRGDRGNAQCGGGKLSGGFRHTPHSDPHPVFMTLDEDYPYATLRKH
ncbi:hypothetical protein AXX16_3996 [Serratia rubidaea]|nr:hypothetical protein AXX16_3996 [Serratia rubidaea]